MNYWHLLVWALIILMSGIGGGLGAMWLFRAKLQEIWPYESMMGSGMAGLAACLLLFIFVVWYGDLRA